MREQTKTNIFHIGNCIEIIRRELITESIDLIFADPPYNLSGNGLEWIDNQTGGPWHMMNEVWDKMSSTEYEEFTFHWISECERVLRESGSIYVACSYHNIGEVMIVLKRLGFRINNIITWHKTNAMPNMTRRTFTHCTEFVVWATKGKGWIFNYSKIKLINPDRQRNGSPKQMRDLWQMPLVQGKERLSNKDGRALHPTQKPEEMLKRIILASSNEQDVVLDPFIGSGTTAVVAQRHGRRWIGIDREEKYIKAAKRRLRSLSKETYNPAEITM